MVLKTSHGDSGQVLTLGTPGHPLFEGGADYSIHAFALPPSYAPRIENGDLTDDVLARRTGALKIYKASDATGSKTFGATTKYALLTAADQLLLPAGGFAVLAHFVATRPSAGNTAYIWSSRPSGQTYHIIKITLSDAGVITVTWKDSGGTERTVACTAVSAGATVHLLAYFSASAGTFTVYINGASSGTPLTGLSSTLKPAQDASVAWAFGVEKQTGAAVTANTNFDGACDDFVLFRNPPPVAMLLKHSGRGWPNPGDDRVVFHYSFDGSSTTVLTDHSWFKNHASLVGTPSNTAAVAMSSMNCNFLGSAGRPDGSRVNLYGSHGRLFYETMRAANS